jgi:hypothetical protein
MSKFSDWLFILPLKDITLSEMDDITPDTSVIQTHPDPSERDLHAQFCL